MFVLRVNLHDRFRERFQFAGSDGSAIDEVTRSTFFGQNSANQERGARVFVQCSLLEPCLRCLGPREVELGNDLSSITSRTDHLRVASSTQSQ